MKHDHPIQGASTTVKAAMKRVIDYDDSRAGMPYEHCATLTGSIALIAVSACRWMNWYRAGRSSATAQDVGRRRIALAWV